MNTATPRCNSKKRLSFTICTFILTLISFGISAQNAVTTHAGSSQGFADATGTSAKFKAPTGICISPDGMFLYVADYSGHRIRKINVATRAVTTIAGSGTSGYADATGTSAMFSYPSGICISGDGTILYVSDYGNSNIRKIILATQEVSTLAGDGNFAYTDNTNGLLASFNSPTDIVNNHDSVLYISDTENHLIRKVDLSTSSVSTIAGMAGVAGFQNGTGINAAFRFPKGMAVSEDALTLYVADNGNHMIRSINLADNTVATIAGDGTPGYADNSDAGIAKFFSPQGVCTVPGQPHLLYVADNNNHRIRKINLTANSVTTIAGNGAVPPASTFADNTIGMNAKFFYPTNLIASPDAINVYVADQGNFRIRRIKTDITTDIEGFISNDLFFDVYPNPAKDELTISLKSQHTEKGKLEIFDQKGKVVMVDDSITISANTIFNKDIISLSNGVYLVKISTSKGFTTRKIILSGK